MLYTGRDSNYKPKSYKSYKAETLERVKNKVRSLVNTIKDSSLKEEDKKAMMQLAIKLIDK